MTKKDLASEQELIASINNKKMEGFELLFDITYRELVNFAYRIVGSESDAEDIVHDVFIKKWESDVVFNDLKALKAYLYTASRNRAIDFLRRTKHSNLALFTDMEQDAVTEAVIDSEVLSAISLAVGKLPPECKKIMEFILQGKSSAEIALLLGLAPSTVRAQKRRGIELLKNILAPGQFAILLTII